MFLADGLRIHEQFHPASFLTDRIARRYELGIPEMASGTALLGDARDLLRLAPPLGASLLITSPPYRGVTDYWNDHWIRLWLLGYDMRKGWKRSARHTGKEEYRALLAAVFREARRHRMKGAAVLVRCDQRKETATICAEAHAEAWPGRHIFVRAIEAPHDGISAEHGRGRSKARELDLLLPGNRGRRWKSNSGLRPGRDLPSSG